MLVNYRLKGWTASKHLTQSKVINDMEVINELSDSFMCLPPMEFQKLGQER